MARPPLSSPDQPAGVRLLLRLYEGLASLKLAMVLIGALAVVLGAATWVENSFGAEAARVAVYGSTWFTGLNVLLFLNVLAATLIRFPWKIHQAGFVVVHAGVLVLLAGCLLTRLGGIKAELPVYEGATAKIAYLADPQFERRHFELTVDQDSGPGQTLTVPFDPGPFNWSDYAGEDSPWYLFPWRLRRRDQGVVYDAGGIRLEVLDYRRSAHPFVLGKLPREDMPEPKLAQVRLSVDGRSEEFWIQGVEETRDDQPLSRMERHVVQSDRRRVAIALRHDTLDLGFETYLHEFDRRLDPGSDTVSHFSSAVDFLDPDRPGEKLNGVPVRIALNEPASVSDPTSGRCYRLYQASYGGPFRRGQPGYPDGRVGKAAPDEVFMSVLSVNYDPGRPLKYAGTLLVFFGLITVYSMRGRGERRE